MTVAGIVVASTTLLLAIGVPTISVPSSPVGPVHAIAIDRSDGHLLVASHSGLYEIALWSPHPTLAGPLGTQRDVTTITSVDQVMYGSARRAGGAGPSIGVATSVDHGQTWSTRGLYGYRELRNLIVGQVNGQLQMFALDGLNSILRSTDGGTYWVMPAQIRANALQTSQGRLYAATNVGVRTSSDGGATWSPPAGPALRLLARGNPRQGALVGIDARGAVWRLRGSIWSRQGSSPAESQALAMTTIDGTLTLIIATNHWIQRSPDWGATWTTVTTW